MFGAMLNNLQFYIDILGRDPSPPPPTSTPSPTNPSPAPGAPPFDEKKKAKNCFAYACQDYSKFVGSPLPSNPANGCDAGKAALLQDYKDKIREVPNHQSCKDDEYKIYMFWGIMGDAGPDFHFYRQNADGTYSHQIGNSKPSNTDGGGKPITDPLSASRWNDDWKSDYNKFRGSFCVKKGGCIIKPGSGIY